MAVEGIGERFDTLVADARTLGGQIRDKLAAVAKEINDLFGADSHPAQDRIVQFLERAAHVAVGTPGFSEQEPADPTSGQPAADTQPASSPEPTSPAPNTASEGTSAP